MAAFKPLAAGTLQIIAQKDTFEPATTSVLVSESLQIGDLNGDGILTPADAVIALGIAAGGGWDPAADVNDDHTVTSLDALMILQAAAEAISL